MKTNRGSHLSAALLLIIAGSPPAWAASFDCSKATSRIDIAICASRQVSTLDGELGVKYQEALARTSDPEAVRSAQKAWLKETRNACQDEACLVAVYQQRIATLSPAPSSSMQEAMANADAEDKADANLPTDAELKKRAEEEAQAAKHAEEVAAAEIAKKMQAEKEASEQLAQKEGQAKRAAEEESQKQYGLYGIATVVVAIVALIIFLLIRHRRGAIALDGSLAKSKKPDRGATTVVVSAATPSTNEGGTKSESAADQSDANSPRSESARVLVTKRVPYWTGWVVCFVAWSVAFSDIRIITIGAALVTLYSTYVGAIYFRRITAKSLVMVSLLQITILFFYGFSPESETATSLSILNRVTSIMSVATNGETDAPTIRTIGSQDRGGSADSLDELRAAYMSFNSRCRDAVGLSTAELLTKMREIRKWDASRERGLGSVDGHLMMLRSIGCAPRK